MAYVRHRKGSDYIGDRTPLNICVKRAGSDSGTRTHGSAFLRLEDGRIYQRPLVPAKNFGGEQAARTAQPLTVRPRLLHTLYQQNLKTAPRFLRCIPLDLVKNQDGAIVGCTAICIETGEVVYFKAKRPCWQPAVQPYLPVHH